MIAEPEQWPCQWWWREKDGFEKLLGSSSSRIYDWLDVKANKAAWLDSDW